MDEIVEWRLQHLLPGLMDTHGIDLWLAIDRENNKDPVAKTIGDRMFLGEYSDHLVSAEDLSNEWLDTETIIRRGDILHSDIGTEYLGLNTDNQHHVYVLRKGETDVPEGLKQALRNSNRLRDIFMSEFVEGRSGNDITFATLERARAEGLTPMVYTHPIGYHQHSGGTIMGADGAHFVDGRQTSWFVEHSNQA